MTKSEKFLDWLKPLLAELLEIPEDEVVLEAELMGKLGADSLMVVEIAQEVESKFGVKVFDKELGKFVTVGDIVNFLVANSEVTEEETSSCEG